MSLFEQACEVRENAHAPYSGFKVGAALRVSSGETFVGCNVENAAYPEGTCAEVGAIAAMVAAGESEIEEIDLRHTAVATADYNLLSDNPNLKIQFLELRPIFSIIKWKHSELNPISQNSNEISAEKTDFF